MMTREIRWGDMRGIRKFEHVHELPDDYRDFLVRLLWVQADTEFASVQQHRPWLDTAPSFEDRWIEARIIADEMRHGWQMIKLLEDFGEEGRFYINDLFNRKEHQHKLDSFNMDFDTWEDVAAFACLVDRVGMFQLRSFQECSYAPLARAIPLMITEENLHIGAGRNALNRIANDPAYYGDKTMAQAAVDKWYPRALDMFGHSGSAGSEMAVSLGIKRWRNEEARKMYVEEVAPILEKMGLVAPEETANRRIL
ncbi:MAG: phenylacetic acid catabolic protein [Chloroflexi bacterium]|nr:phenylacetic acid catabolic protein [Chloroflexota bacterium]